jgi:hypothetical protein
MVWHLLWEQEQREFDSPHPDHIRHWLSGRAPRSGRGETAFDSQVSDHRILVAGCDGWLGVRKRGVRPSGIRRGFGGCANEPLNAKF